jgi:predicted ATPase/DNA-binding CsgD family transcriptional regulator
LTRFPNTAICWFNPTAVGATWLVAPALLYSHQSFNVIALNSRHHHRIDPPRFSLRPIFFIHVNEVLIPAALYHNIAGTTAKAMIHFLRKQERPTNMIPMIEPLTEREQEILLLITQGMTNQEIAERLYLSLGTVKAHNHNIFSKLDVSNRTQALRRAQELGLVESDGYQPSVTVLPSTECDNFLPQTPFIGRQTELEKLASLIADQRVRLITLLGAGGMGKTRLAQEIAQRHQDYFRDGVFFVPLAQLPESQTIVTTLMDVFKLQSRSDENAEKVIQAALQKKSLLLLLDNFEHVLNSADFVLRLLQAAPNLKILITSRERLNVSLEVTYVLTGLDYQKQATAVDEATSDASRLFQQYARQSKPDFDPMDDELAAVDRICKLTQGMPLALVLAAGWIDLLSLNEIADEISQGIGLLESQMRDLPERQRSMRATILYSWNRLTADQRRVLAKLSVFRGSFSRQAAEEIAGATLPILQILLNRSFITTQHGRYSIHELIRQFGWEELMRATHAGEVANAHCHHYLTRLYELEDDLKGKSQVAALNEIHQDFDNIRVAWHWAIQTEQALVLDRAVETLYVFAFVSGRMQDVIELFQFAEDHLDYSLTHRYPHLLERIWRRLMGLTLLVNPEQLTLTDVQTSLELAKQQPDRLENALALDLLACYLAFVDHDYSQAISLHEQNIEALRSIHDHYYTAAAYHKMGYCQLQINGLDGLIRHTRKSYEIAKRHGNLYNERASLNNLGSAALYLGRYHEAEQHYRETLPIAQTFGYESSRHELINFTHILFLQGKFDEARDLLRIAWGGTSGMLDLHGQSFGHCMNAFLAAVQEDYNTALYHALHSLQEKRNDVSGALAANLVAAMAYCGLQEPITAQKHVTDALHYACLMNFAAPITWALPMLAMIQAQRGQFEQAVMIIALVRTHPLSARGWLDRWLLFTETEAMLQEQLDKFDYSAAWRHGETLSLEAVAQDLLNSAPIPA